MDAFTARARNFEFRKLAVHGAISGLFFAQTLSWQQLVDSLIVTLVGVEKESPAIAFWRAMIITMFTTLVAWGIISIAHACERCEQRLTSSVEG